MMVPLLAASIILSSLTGRTSTTGATIDCGSNKRNVLFLVDNTSMNISEFAILKQALVDLVDTFTIGRKNIRVSVITYPDIVMTLWTSFMDDKSALKNALLKRKHYNKRVPLLPSKTFSTAYLALGFEEEEEDVSNAVLLFAGDQVSSLEEEVAKTNKLKEAKKVAWFCLGVKNAEVSQLKLLASLPSSDHVFFADSYDDLGTLVPELAKIACDNCSTSPCQGGQICDLSTNTCIDPTPQKFEVTFCRNYFFERQSHRISGCPVVMATFAESPIVCAVHCRSTEGCTNFNMARNADILNNCQLLTCAGTPMLTESGDHDFYTPICAP